MRTHALAAAAALFACAATPAAVVEVFDSYGDDGTHRNAGTRIGEFNNKIDYVASGFTPERTGRVVRFETAMTRLNFVPETITLSLLSGVGTGTPADNAIWSQTYAGGTLTRIGNSRLNPPSVFDVEAGPTLEAGVTYYLYAEIPNDVADNGERVSWWNTPVERADRTLAFWANRDVAGDPDGFTWDVFPATRGNAFRVLADVPAVPEPTSLAILAGPALLLRRRR